MFGRKRIAELKSEIGSLRELLERYYEEDMKHVVEGIFGPKETSPDPEPSRIFEDQLSKRDKQIKRLKARVKKLTSDNKAMAAEILHNQNNT